MKCFANELAVEDITEQLLAEVDTNEFLQDNNCTNDKEELETALVAKEKALDAKMKKIDEVF
jgi:hypothetical protein